MLDCEFSSFNKHNILANKNQSNARLEMESLKTLLNSIQRILLFVCLNKITPVKWNYFSVTDTFCIIIGPFYKVHSIDSFLANHSSY